MADKSKNRLEEQSKKLNEEQTDARDESEIEISMENVYQSAGPRATPASLVIPTTSADDPDSNREVREHGRIGLVQQNVGNNSQRN